MGFEDWTSLTERDSASSEGLRWNAGGLLHQPSLGISHAIKPSYWLISMQDLLGSQTQQQSGTRMLCTHLMSNCIHVERGLTRRGGVASRCGAAAAAIATSEPVGGVSTRLVLISCKDPTLCHIQASLSLS